MSNKELCKQLEEGTFYDDSFGKFFKIPVLYVRDRGDLITIHLDLVHGEAQIDVAPENIKKVRRPSNIIAKFKWCYILRNDYGGFLGWIGLREDNELFKAMDKAIDEAMQEEI